MRSTTRRRSRTWKPAPGSERRTLARSQGRVSRTPVPKLGTGVADIRPDPAAEVQGIVWCIAAAEGDALDRQEGVHATPPRYRHIEVTVTTPGGEALDCLAYQVAEPQAEHIAPSAAYLETMLRGARAAGLPEAYVARIEAIAAG